MGWPRTRARSAFALSLGRLIGHLAAGTGIFAAILVLSWLLSLLFRHLNSVSPFPPEIAELFATFEVALFWADVLVSSSVLLFGIYTFLWDVIARRN